MLYRILLFSVKHQHESVGPMTSSRPLSSPSPLPSIFPSIRVFSNEVVLPIRWLKHWSFNFSISPSNEYSELISFRIDWFDLLVVQSQESSPTPQFKTINSSVLSFIVKLSHPYITTGKTIVLTRQIFIGKVMSLHFNMLSRFV